MAELPEMTCRNISAHEAHAWHNTTIFPGGDYHCPGYGTVQRTSNPDLPFIDELSQDELDELDVPKLDQMVSIKDKQIAFADETIHGLERRLLQARSRRNALNLRRRTFIAEQERRK